MSSDESRSLSESLARRLSDLAARSASTEQEHLRRLLERREQLRSAAEGPIPSLEDLAARAATLGEELAGRSREAASLDESLQTLHDRERRLAEDLQRSFAQLCGQCQELIGRVPLLGTAPLHGWLAWLEDWHRRSQRPFEPVPDWRGHYTARSTAHEAMVLVEPLLDFVQRLDVGDGHNGLALAAVPAEIEREGEELSRLEAAIAARLEAVGPLYGRIVEDLPDPSGADSSAKLERIEALLLYLDRVLGRFAASARLERQMLEALA